MNRIKAMFAALLLAACGGALAQEPAACRNVRFVDVGWTDIAATTGLASVVLEALGYRPVTTIASVPIAFSGLKSKQIDVFLGYWNPSMTPLIEPFLKAGQVKVLAEPNLTGAKYTLAVPDYVAAAGLRDFKDIARFKAQLDGKIYGIEAGNDGNRLIDGMIRARQYGLGGFRLVESSEAGMLAELERAVRQKKWMVFLAWEPHPMNVRHKLRYLSGGDAVFGPNFGAAKVFTAVPPDYEARCPNVGRLLRNLRFSTDMENRVMGPIMDKIRPETAARDYLKKNPAALAGWLAGVNTFDGRPGLSVVGQALAR
ncbi:glycine betaine/proline transport system substrate-binding protein [Chromobacterium alkanivorans]|uniref:choline ABC transporter substrate-binding protein n=1 Tax=Chromobacterium alkanivorans TaxID=1071719 RepID=UPI001966D964|nr:choline ABC transporter substrate-binding protein [Chromobacterium alkanivorans]MBN3006509.1 choline ABC transporter substrate-binding protein [Chromobacterium alkanivorans]MCS3806767.1 glycine betaine/proline transport system substrate-binding protein [Chromobacterium alkanivorans]MCS3821061.1 glycine betaine/proline transport system substrate-binding protein [Chromobacterium alkanivorans]MCS3876027.1 glycine betaine/proline transport system substrate-binding protein [Chromobacterium alkani